MSFGILSDSSGVAARHPRWCSCALPISLGTCRLRYAQDSLIILLVLFHTSGEPAAGCSDCGSRRSCGAAGRRSGRCRGGPAAARGGNSTASRRVSATGSSDGAAGGIRTAGGGGCLRAAGVSAAPAAMGQAQQERLLGALAASAAEASVDPPMAEVAPPPVRVGPLDQRL